MSSLNRIRRQIESPDAAQPRPRYLALIVDDEEPIRRLVDRMLRAAGLETVVAEDGDAALAAASTLNHLDVLVTDLMMPKMTGEELAGRLRARDVDLQVLYMTAFADRLFAGKTTLSPGEAFLDKPFTPKALTEAVWLLLTGHTTAPARESRNREARPDSPAK